jgi:Dipeptide/tripeptide permease
MPNNTSLSNHPKGLWVLALTELCERFAFWGVGNLLVLYLIEYYQFSNVKATHIYGIFTGCAAFLPLIGGWVADRSSYRMSILFGALINMVGCLFLAWGTLPMLYVGLVIIAGGFGLFTPSLLVVLGHLYREKEHLRQAGFSIYYGSINIGVFLAMFSLGIIAKEISWNAAFLVAAAVQTLGILPIAWYFHHHKIDYQAFQAHQTQFRIDKTPLSRPDRRRVLVVIIFCLLSIFFWTSYNQAFSSMSIFVHSFMNKEIGGYQIPEGVFLSSESFFLILLAPLLAYLYSWLQKRHIDPSVAVKTIYSFLFMAAAFFIMMMGAKSIPAGEASAAVSSSYVISTYFLIAISEMLLAPIGLSMVSQLSPQKLTGMLVGFWYVCVGFAFYLGGLLAGLMEKGETLSSFFGFFIIVAFIPAFFLILFNKKLTHMARRDSNEIDSTPHIPR